MLKTRDADVVVAGAGPAGAAFATRVAAAGYDVLLVDRARFPRDKVCGDFVGPAALGELSALGITNDSRFAHTNATALAGVHIDGEHLMTFRLPHIDGEPAEGRVIPRMLLDAWLVDAATRAGARLLEEHTIAGYESTQAGAVVLARRNGAQRRLRARLVVGADGSASAVARSLRGSSHPRTETIIAVRGYYENVGGDERRCDLHFGNESFPGYCWLFPTGGSTANLGIGMVAETLPPVSKHLREVLTDLVARNGALGSRLANARPRGKIVGWPLATYDPKLALSAERVLLIGDAAGLVNPMNGEGIQYALTSARWAAETAVPALRDDDLGALRLSAYAERVAAEVGIDMALSRTIAHVIANRALNGVWLGYLRQLVLRADRDRGYGEVTGGVMAGVAPARDLLAGSIVLGSLHALGAFVAQRRNVVELLGTAIETALTLGEHHDATRRWAHGSVQSWSDLLSLARDTAQFCTSRASQSVR